MHQNDNGNLWMCRHQLVYQPFIGPPWGYAGLRVGKLSNGLQQDIALMAHGELCRLIKLRSLLAVQYMPHWFTCPNVFVLLPSAVGSSGPGSIRADRHTHTRTPKHPSSHTHTHTHTAGPARHNFFSLSLSPLGKNNCVVWTGHLEAGVQRPDQWIAKLLSRRVTHARARGGFFCPHVCAGLSV